MELVEQLRGALAGIYRVERELGRGGMAVVFLAEDLRHSRRVAVKVLRPELASAVGPDRFLREIEIAARLQHPHILPLFDSGADGDLLFYVMPFVEGESLRARLDREGQLPLEESIQIGAEVADALAYAHALGVVHRDIKPENILLSGGHAIVADFGIAHAVCAAGEPRLTDSGIAIGTPAYMSPEQATGSPLLDGRSDVYALACVVYEMLGGEPPFTGSSAQAVLARHVLEHPPSLEILRPTVSDPLRVVILRALAKSPADRFATAGQFREALRNPSAAATGRGAKAGGVRARRFLIAALTAAAVLGGFGLWRGLLRPPPLDAHRIVVFPLGATDPSLEQAEAGWDVALALGAALEHSEPLKWIDGWSLLPDRLRVAPRLLSQALAVDISRKQRARFYLFGVIRGTASATAVVLRLYDVAGDSLIAQETRTGAHDRLGSLALAAVEPLLPRLLAPGDQVDLSPLTERAPGAIALVLQGEREYRRSHFALAAEFYRRAVAEDSTLVYGAVKGAQAASWGGRMEDGHALLQIALRRDSLLPPKYRVFAHGLQAYYAGEGDSAVARFTAALERDPRWSEAWMALGEVYYHLLPEVLPQAPSLHSQAEAAFERATAVDTAFTPPLVHLAEGHARAGNLDALTPMVRHLERVEADSIQVQELRLLEACLRTGPGSLRDAAAQRPAAVMLASKALAAGGANFRCAEEGFRGVMADPAAPASNRWAALLGLHGVLLASGRHAELRRVLDSNLAAGVRATHLLYVFGALAGAPLAPQAEEAARVARQGAGDDYRGARQETRWLFGLWHARRGDVALAERIADGMAEAAARSESREDRLLAHAVAAEVALARHDTAKALDRLQAVTRASVGRNIPWSLGPPLAPTRLLLAELLLARGRFRDAHRAAAVFDHPEPIAFVPWLPASLALRARASEALGQRALAAALDARIAVLRPDLNVSSASAHP